MEWIEKVIGELPEIDLGKDTFASISGSVWIIGLSLLFTVVLIILGYRNGIIAELSGLAGIVCAYLVLRIFSPTIKSNVGDLTGTKKFVVYGAIAIVVYIVVKKIMEFIGKTLRHIPVLGFVSGVFGAAAGFLKAMLVLIIVQMTTGVDVLGTIITEFDKLAI